MIRMLGVHDEGKIRGLVGVVGVSSEGCVFTTRRRGILGLVSVASELVKLR